METVTQEEIGRRRERAGEWIVEADKHIRAAKHLVKKDGLQTLTLSHIQQSMENATKGLARASGVEHKRLKSEIGHNNLFLFGKITEIVIDSLEGYEHANEILATLYPQDENYDTSKRIGDMLAATASPKQVESFGARQYAKDIFTSAMSMTPGEVKFLLDSFDRAFRAMRVPNQAKDLIRKLTADPVSVESPKSGSDWTDEITSQVARQLVTRIGARIDPILIAVIQDLVRNPAHSEQEIAAELEATGGKYYFDGDQIIRHASGILDMLTANIGLLVIGSLVWAHEAFPRYPAEPGSPDSIKQAAAQRKMGVKHYTADMGVITHIHPLTTRADKTIQCLKRSYKGGYLLMSARDVNFLRL